VGHSVEKQAIPVEFFEQILTDEKLRMLIDNLWGCGNGIFLQTIGSKNAARPFKNSKAVLQKQLNDGRSSLLK